MFINISNHQSDGWSPPQREAALALAPQIIDLPFPQVPPTADEAAVEQLADDLLTQLPTGVTHAMLMGEFTLTVALLVRLQAKGITCLAATTERRISEDSEGNKISRFEFIRFRRYPMVAHPGH